MNLPSITIAIILSVALLAIGANYLGDIYNESADRASAGEIINNMTSVDDAVGLHNSLCPGESINADASEADMQALTEEDPGDCERSSILSSMPGADDDAWTTDAEANLVYGVADGMNEDLANRVVEDGRFSVDADGNVIADGEGDVLLGAEG